MEILTISNQKGGVGKTTITVNIAVGIQRQFPKAKVLVVDIDPQGNSTYHFLKKMDYDASIERLFRSEKYTGSDVIYRTRFENIDIIPADVRLSKIEFVASSLVKAHERLKDYLKGTGSAYDIALIDTPPSLGFLAVNALMATNHLLIPAVPEKLAISGLLDLYDTVRKVQGFREHDPINIMGVMPVMVDLRYRSHKKILKEMKEKMGDAYREDLMINTNAPLKDATAKGRTIYEYNYRANSFKQFLNVSRIVYREVLNLDQKERQQEEAKATG